MFTLSNSLLLLLTAVPVSSDDAKNTLTPEQEKIVRVAVYNNTPQLATRDSDLWRILLVPEPLEKLYKTHPRAVIEVLLVIMEGSRPWDSALAAGYAFELMGGPGRGTVCVEFFEEKTYDDVKKSWETTPRKHWMGKVRDKLKEMDKPQDKRER